MKKLKKKKFIRYLAATIKLKTQQNTKIFANIFSMLVMKIFLFKYLLKNYPNLILIYTVQL